MCDYIVGRSGGLIIEWITNDFLCSNSWSFTTSIGEILFSREICMTYYFMNVYEPYQ